MKKSVNYLSRATDILFISSPVETSIGVLVGFSMHGITSLLLPLFPNEFVNSLSHLGIYTFVFIGVFLANIVGRLRRNKLDTRIEAALQSIELARKHGSLNEIEAKLEYRKLLEKVLTEYGVSPTEYTEKGIE